MKSKKLDRTGKKKTHRKHSSSSSGSDYEWTDGTKPTNPTNEHAELPKSSTWISEVQSVEDFVDLFSSSHGKKPSRSGQPDQASQSITELNPHWRDGGKGLPENVTEKAKLVPKSILTKDNEAWLFKSYKRCLDQARDEGIDVEELLLQRWDRATVDDMLAAFAHGTYRHFSDSRSTGHMTHQAPPRWRKSRPNDFGKAESSSTELGSGHQTIKNTDVPKATLHVEDSSAVSTADTTETEERFVTADDINAMAAKVLKAELTGDPTKVNKLKANLEKLREAHRRGIKVRMHALRKRPVTNDPPVTIDKPIVIPLTQMDDRGMERPLRIISPSSSSFDQRKTKSFRTHDAGGKRVAYLPTDSAETSVRDMVREEQSRSSYDVEMEFTRLASKAGRKVDDEYDDAFVPKRSFTDRDVARIKQDAVAAYKRRAFAEASCTTCLERVPKHLVISVGEKVFLSLPGHVSLVPGHCLLTPYEHIGSTTRLEERTLDELANFKRQLVTMFKRHLDDSGCVFIEIAARPDSVRAHTQIECIPVPPDIFTSLPAYFKKALSELGSEWDQNRRVITLKPTGLGARGSVPPKFAYVAVEFGVSDGGLARVIDNGADVPSYFGREIVGGILEKDSFFWRKPKPESFDRLRKKVIEFENMWHPFNKWAEHDPRNRLSVEQSNASPTPEGPELPPGLLD
ncbi:CWF19-like protein 2 [Clonorchis sinensis]|uniref:CWF19-like protein 2 n=1 Tax=Clonorchis sinensis TaxID=79923 RepID=A0A8T1MHR5_CLOSI|nr:CWF19-like protein 2 [Clonorchis sinensis]